MTPHERALSAAIRRTIGAAYGAVSALATLMRSSDSTNIDEGEHAEELEAAKDTLAFYVEKLFRDIKLLADRLGARSMVSDIKMRTPSEKDASVLDNHDGDFYSPHVYTAVRFFDSLESLNDGQDVTGLSIFKTILQNTPKIISRINIEPRNEKDVRDAVAMILGFSFRDVVRDVHVPKNIKVYKPDLAVRSLRAAAEYKFIDTEQEAKKALDETYSDMKGYGSTYDWRHFYAVYYMTDNFYTQADVDAEYKLVGADLDWVPLVVVGKGERKKK